jgi:hypothetical protein
MAHAKSLRVIGQSLEVAKLRVFELETDGPNYIVKTDLLTKASEWVLRFALGVQDVSEQTSRQSKVSRSVRFTPADISRLDEQAQKQRKTTSVHKQMHGRLSQVMRSVGDHLDGIEASAFYMSWTYDSVSVDYQSLDGQRDTRTFTAEKLEQLESRSRFRRLGRTRFNAKWSGMLRRD